MLIMDFIYYFTKVKFNLVSLTIMEFQVLLIYFWQRQLNFYYSFPYLSVQLYQLKISSKIIVNFISLLHIFTIYFNQFDTPSYLINDLGIKSQLIYLFQLVNIFSLYICKDKMHSIIESICVFYQQKVTQGKEH
ncbi:unnamed protein product (macronuclear) [Paramecium tetraurelia]|uniref:Transmembrane protein n=1 Tax=Paramecium tetraurelia TaxID=5888 RepID=A0BL98_PARTE|nr:uncharacterized protein GSPATT00029947001 [Paramecium tetraurelia]CAK59315.1 unnamed protein product [Paramecium tetraurelia]|eukprot:XP_001426713.1 hypothetical protein (macronuclear) [Paramecium tetraurelia strain d4-2]